MKLPGEELPVSALLISSMCTRSWFLAVTLSILFVFQASHAVADDWYTHAPAAYCECNEPDAFPGVSKLFSRAQLQQIETAFEETDPRKPIDRMEARFKPLNAIGQIKSELGFGTGVLVGDDLVLTNAHVVGAIGKQITFNVGQTPADSSSRWTYSTQGEVIAMGKDFLRDDQQDWALIRIKRPLGKIVGSLEPAAMNDDEMIYASGYGQIITAGFPGFKDPRYLWGQRGVRMDYMNDESRIKSASSSGMSGGALVWESAPGKFELIGLVQGSVGEGYSEGIEIGIDGRLSYSSSDSFIVNFRAPSFGKDFGPDYNKALGND